VSYILKYYIPNYEKKLQLFVFPYASIQYFYGFNSTLFIGHYGKNIPRFMFENLGAIEICVQIWKHGNQFRYVIIFGVLKIQHYIFLFIFPITNITSSIRILLVKYRMYKFPTLEGSIFFSTISASCFFCFSSKFLRNDSAFYVNIILTTNAKNPSLYYRNSLNFQRALIAFFRSQFNSCFMQINNATKAQQATIFKNLHSNLEIKCKTNYTCDHQSNHNFCKYGTP